MLARAFGPGFVADCCKPMQRPASSIAPWRAPRARTKAPWGAPFDEAFKPPCQHAARCLPPRSSRRKPTTALMPSWHVGAGVSRGTQSDGANQQGPWRRHGGTLRVHWDLRRSSGPTAASRP